MWTLGPYRIDSPVVLAPMAGVSDLPFRQLCRAWGAGLATGEMLTSDSRLWTSRKSSWRLSGLQEDAEPRVVQIAGSEPDTMAEAARACVARGAQVIDINMGCPAKKVCRRAAGSALLRDEDLVGQILEAVIRAVPVPVTLKMRTGWCPDSRRAVAVGRLAESLGIQAITLHGRTRACGYHQPAEYATIAGLVDAVSIPVIANGDIATPQQARAVLDRTGAAAVMIGRAAYGQPWLFRRMRHFLLHGEDVADPAIPVKWQVVHEHVQAIHGLYGEYTGVRIARKHVGWYGGHLAVSPTWIRTFNQLASSHQQLQVLRAMQAGATNPFKDLAA